MSVNNSIPQCDLIHLLFLGWSKFNTRTGLHTQNTHTHTHAEAVLITSMIHCINIDQMNDDDDADNNNSMRTLRVMKADRMNERTNE